jgi:chromosome segregation ATPase
LRSGREHRGQKLPHEGSDRALNLVAFRAFFEHEFETGQFTRTSRRRAHVPNPQRKALAKELRACRASVQELEQAYGQQARANPEAKRPTMRGFKIAQADLTRQLRDAEARCEQLEERLAACPKRVALNTLLDEQEIVRLAPEAKHFTDSIKMLACRAENGVGTLSDAQRGANGG